MKLYHATELRNLERIAKEGIIPGISGVVFLADSADSAFNFVAIRMVEEIVVLEVNLPPKKIRESFDHSQSFFQCRAYYHKGKISPKKITNAWAYRRKEDN